MQTVIYAPFSRHYLRSNSLINNIILSSLGALLLALSANISIPLNPIPFSFQSLAVLLVGAMLGKKLGLLALFQTIILGLVGLPVFADGSNTLTALSSPSAGYIYGFIASIYIAAWGSEKGFDRRLWTALILFACAHQIIFVFGVLYLSVYLKISLGTAFTLGYLPFVGFDLLKFGFAAVLMVFLWRTQSKNQVI